ncbi:MAG: adenylosuccinate synthase [Bacteroidota bacterium]|jgi:adenylosuccinate synthase|nr:adenylosuccinate synthase [Bacteroidota bacterium]MEC8679242.1 adenylosuccinate synthase [Bacteroidota bacterium]MEC8701830.1 adenylosuccinate synthase [Bacteroidota bacterium]|tara:strand:+ start:4226 stop:5494 length:1269 start_codon:yes stop_codon:yes gene_type:complete
MSVDVLLGLQWGDEGKGKIVDFLAPKYDLVARFQGGPNAGHTLEFDGIKHVLHQIPSGIFREDKQNIIGNGVVLDPVIFMNEVSQINKKFNISLKDILSISTRAQLISPVHRLLDKVLEENKGKNKIGSTLKGIGPTYQDKIGRHGLRVGEILSDNFKEKYDKQKSYHNYFLEGHYDNNFSDEEKTFFECINKLKEFKIVDTEYLINKNVNRKKKVLAEGAQGTLLDIDFGSYPFVTSSNTTTAGACIGLGISPKKIDKVFGIFKAYCTRVGAGPFPTELFDDIGEKIAKNGNEFGSTTGRPRRCGWLDLPALKYSIMLNGVSDLYMMKADVLSGFSEVKVCVGYEYNNEKIDYFPSSIESDSIKPIYKSFKGWTSKSNHARSLDDLEDNFKKYINFIESEVGVSIKLVSLGPDREETIYMK